MVGYIMDTSAWIEVFRGSHAGEQVTEYLFPKINGGGSEISDIITPTIVIMELKSKYIREGKENIFSDDLANIRRISRIEMVNIDEPLAIKSGGKHGHEHATDIRISYNDCILLSLAEKMNMKVISTDGHFEGSIHAIHIKEEGNNEN